MLCRRAGRPKETFRFVAKLPGGVAVINAGAVPSIELKEKKARVEDALHVTRAADFDQQLLLVGLHKLQPVNAAIVFDIEGAQTGAPANGAAGNKGVQHTKPLREVMGFQLGQCAAAILLCRPYQRQRFQHLHRTVKLGKVSCVLDQFHEHNPGNGWQLLQTAKPLHSRPEASLNIDDDISIEQEH